MKSGVRGIFFFFVFFFFSFLSFVWRATIGRGHRIYYLKLERQFIQTAIICASRWLVLSHIFTYLIFPKLQTDIFWLISLSFLPFFIVLMSRIVALHSTPGKVHEFINLGLSVECAAFESLKFIKLPRGVQRPILLAKRTLSSLYRGLEVKSDTDKCSLVIHAAV